MLLYCCSSYAKKNRVSATTILRYRGRKSYSFPQPNIAILTPSLNSTTSSSPKTLLGLTEWLIQCFTKCRLFEKWMGDVLIVIVGVMLEDVDGYVEGLVDIQFVCKIIDPTRILTALLLLQHTVWLGPQ